MNHSTIPRHKYGISECGEDRFECAGPVWDEGYPCSNHLKVITHTKVG